MRRSIPLLKFVDYHRVLGVPRDAGKDAVRSRYMELAKQWHPDRNKSPEAPAKFKAISEAYDVLKDDAKRAAAAEEAEFSTGGGARGGRRGGFHYRSPHERAQQSAARDAFHGSLTWFELLVHPSILMRVIPALMAISVAFSLAVGNPKIERREADRNPLVAAWRNPRTKRWEVPAPWDPDFRKLNPKIEQVARNLVYDGK